MPPTSTGYCCPGERSPISRAVHLGRLASFYPECRACPHREDTGTLSIAWKKRFGEVVRRHDDAPLFDEDVIAGQIGAALDPSSAQRIAQAFGTWLWRQQSQVPRIVLAHDGRAVTAELVAALSAGLQWAGCAVIECGAATAPAALVAQEACAAAGALVLGGHARGAQRATIAPFASGGRPLSAHNVGQLAQMVATGIDRPARHAPTVERYEADSPYRIAMSPYFHALRPLRIVLDSPHAVLSNWLGELLAPLECELIDARRPGAVSSIADSRPAKTTEPTWHEAAMLVTRHSAHLGVWIDGLGEELVVVDELAQAIESAALATLLAEHLIGHREAEAVVVSEDLANPITRQTGNASNRTAANRSAVWEACASSHAALGFGPGGRVWRKRGHFAADGLEALAALLVVLSRSDRPLSAVVEDSQCDGLHSSGSPENPRDDD